MELYELWNTSTGGTVSSGIRWEIERGGTAREFKVSSGGKMHVLAGGEASGTVVSNGGMLVFESGCLSGGANHIQSGGILCINSGATVSPSEAGNGAILKLMFTNSEYNGIKAVPTTFDISSNGSRIFCSKGKLNGWDMKTSGCYLWLLDGASAGTVKVSSGCSMDVGGFAANGHYAAAVERIEVFAGGSAGLGKPCSIGLATVHSGGSMTVGEYAENTTLVEDGGYLAFIDPSILTPDEYYDQNVKIKPNTFKNVVLSGSGRDATAHSGTVASHTTLKDGANLLVYNGGKAVDTVVSGGYLTVNSGGVASGVSFDATTSNGVVHVSSGGRVTGRINLGSASMIVEDGGVIDFDISALAGGNDALLVNYNMIPVNVGNPHHTITVSGTSQKKGVYSLATQATSLRVDSDWRPEEQKIFTICDTSGTKVGAVLVGKKTRVGDQTYALNLNSGSLALTVAAYVDGEELWYEKYGYADDGTNDYLCDKRKELNPKVSKFVTTSVSESNTDILLDTKGSVSKDGKKNYVGGDDEADFARITMKSAAKLSFTVTATDAVEFTLWRLIPGRNDTYTMKSVQTATLKKNRQTGEYEATTKTMMVHQDEEFYVSVESKNAKKGGEAFYNVQVNRNDSVFFSKGDNSDDWDDLEEMGDGGSVGSCRPDSSEGLVTRDWVGFGDEIDYKSFKINSAANLLLWVEASDEAEFALYQLNEADKKGKYSLKKLESAKLSKNKQYTPDNDEPKYYKIFKPILITAGTYYISMKSTNAAKGGSADYEVYYNGTEFFSKGDSSDDWDDLEEKGAKGKVGANVSLNPNMYTVTQDWVGYGDAVDYKKITLDSAAKLSLYVYSFDNMKFSLCALNEPDKRGRYSLKTIQSLSLKRGKWDIDCDATTKPILLKAGTYYIRMESANAAKGGSASYEVTINARENVFYVYADDEWNDVLCDRKTKKLDSHEGSFETTALTFSTTYVLLDRKDSVDIGGGWMNFVGYDDEIDYAKITLAKGATVSFDLEAMDAAKFTIWRLVPGKDKTYTQKSLQATTLKKGKKDTTFFASTKAISLVAGTYYISMESTNASKGGNAYYTVALNKFVLDNRNAAALTGPDDAQLAAAGGPTFPDAGLSMPDTAAPYSAETAAVPLAAGTLLCEDETTVWQPLVGLA